MLSLYRTLSLRYLRQHRTRAALVVATIMLGVAAWVATTTLNQSMEKAIQTSATPLAGTADLHVSNDEAWVPRTLAAELEQIPGVRGVRPLILERVLLPDLGNQVALVVGIDFQDGGADAQNLGIKLPENFKEKYQSTAMLRRVFALTGWEIDKLVPSPVLVGQELDKSLRYDSRGCFNVLAGGHKSQLMRIDPLDATGPLATLGGSTLVMDSEAAGRLLKRPGMVSRLDLTLQPETDRDQVFERVKETLGDRAKVLKPDTRDNQVRDVLIGLKVGFSVSGIFALVVGMFLIYNVLSVTVAERRHDIGILRSLGATRAQVARLFLGEAALLGLIGVSLGLPVGLGLAYFSLGPVREVLRDIFLPVQGGTLEVPLSTFISAAVAGMATTLLAALVPAVRAAFEEPADAVRRVPPSMGLVVPLILLGVCLLMLLGGASLVAFREFLRPRWGTYGGVILIFPAMVLAASLLSAFIARLLQPLTRRVLGIEGRLAADNLVRSPGRTGLVIAALAAVVAMTVETSGVIRSNEDAILQWMDQALTADLFVTSGGPISASGQTMEMPENLGAKLEEQYPGSRILAVCFRYLPWQQDGRPTLIFLVALDAQTYYEVNKQRQSPVPGLELFARLKEKGTAIVSENFKALNGVKDGDLLTLQGNRGPITVRVVGSVVDYSWNRGTVIVDRQHYRQDFDANRVNAFDVYLPRADPEEAEQVRKHVQQSALGTEHALFVLTRSELRDRILNMIRRLYGLAYTQEIVVGIVAALGVLMALLISVLQRRRELGLLRAVGATRTQVLRSVLAEALLMGVIGTLIGVLIGAPLEYYVVRVILFEEAGFWFPVTFPWAEAGTIACLSLLIAVFAGMLPAWQAGRLHIAEAIAYE